MACHSLVWSSGWGSRTQPWSGSDSIWQIKLSVLASVTICPPPLLSCVGSHRAQFQSSFSSVSIIYHLVPYLRSTASHSIVVLIVVRFISLTLDKFLDNISPILASLLWLPEHFRIHLKKKLFLKPSVVFPCPTSLSCYIFIHPLSGQLTSCFSVSLKLNVNSEWTALSLLFLLICLCTLNR